MTTADSRESLNTPLSQRTGSALFWNAIQQIGVNGIFLVRVVILARLLLPEDFGLLAIATTAIGVLSNVTELGMIPALVQRAQVSRQHYDIAWTVGVVRSLAIGTVVFLAAPIIAAIFAEPRSVSIIRALAVVPVIEATASIRMADLTRDLRFRSPAVASVTGALANTIISIGLAPRLGVWALVAGTLAGPTAYVVMSYYLAPHRPRLTLDRSAVRPLVRYGRWIFLTSLMTVGGDVTLRVVISRQFGAAELGLYFLAAKLAFFPTGVSTQVFGAVAFPLYARLQADARQAAKAFRSMFSSILLIVMPVFVLIISLAPSLVDNVLGPSWEGTAPLIRVLAIVGTLGLAVDAAVPLLKGLGQPYRVAALEGLQSLLLVMSAWWFTWHFGLIGAGLAWLVAIAASLVASVVFLERLLPSPFAGIKAPLGATLVASVLGAVAALGIDNLVPGLIGLLLAGLSAAIVMGALLWLLDRRFDLGLTRDLAKAFPQVAALIGPSE